MHSVDDLGVLFVAAQHRHETEGTAICAIWHSMRVVLARATRRILGALRARQ